MKFEEMVSNKSATKKAKTLKIAMLAAIVITVFFVLYFLLKSLMGGNEKPVEGSGKGSCICVS